jgi:hypothetical protein
MLLLGQVSKYVALPSLQRHNLQICFPAAADEDYDTLPETIKHKSNPTRRELMRIQWQRIGLTCLGSSFILIMC